MHTTLLKKIFSLALAISILQSSISAAAQLNLAEGKMLVGGQLSLPFEYNYRPQTLLGINASPEFSYFMFSNISLGTKISVEYTIYDSMPHFECPVVWSVAVQAKYFFDIGSIYLFTGLGLSISENDFAMVSLRGSVDFPFGALIPMTENVALTLCAPLRIHFKSTSFFEKVKVEPGYFGVVAFM